MENFIPAKAIGRLPLLNLVSMGVLHAHADFPEVVYLDEEFSPTGKNEILTYDLLHTVLEFFCYELETVLEYRGPTDERGSRWVSRIAQYRQQLKPKNGSNKYTQKDLEVIANEHFDGCPIEDIPTMALTGRWYMPNDFQTLCRAETFMACQIGTFSQLIERVRTRREELFGLSVERPDETETPDGTV